ncbi:MAG: peptidoglycan-associated lipoprotein Pal [Burkholderiaceae bacterium]|nr:peptidoglycan-associated lipoprotein Pal [Burkholderiaceae bacterium]
MRQYSAIALAVSTAMLFAACSSTKLDDKPKIEDKPVQQPVQQTSDTRAVTPITTNDLPAPADSSRSVYFDFDSYVVKDEYANVIQANSKYLASKKDRKATIQGNTDERGTAEYNLALGQKRAEAVRKQLAATGIADSQLEAVSFGKEKPKAQGHDESAWSQNRRADIVY